MTGTAPRPSSIRALLVGMLALAALLPLAAKEIPAERVQVSWAPAQRLSEVKNNQAHRGWMRPEEWMKRLSDHLRQRADAVLPPGDRLDVTIDDIKLAGDFEPWHGPDAQDIRFMKDLYPPRIDLHYRLIGPDGKTLREGTGKLRDLSYLEHSVPDDTDPLRYDKRLIDEWLRREFGRDKG